MTKTVAVLKGGWSAERDVSLIGAQGVEAALRDAGYQVRAIDVTRDLQALITALTPRPDVVFNMLHGPGGEDGTIQAVLDMMGIPYTHSGVRASAIGMDKKVTKDIARAHGVTVAPHIIMHIDDIKARGIDFPKPYVVKPVDQGSSFGVTIIQSADDTFDPASWAYGDLVMIEGFIKGRELTVAVMDGVAQTVCELRVHGGFYDFEAKYNDPRTEHIIPAPVPQDVFDLAMRYAERMYAALGCADIARCDFRYDDSLPAAQGLVLLEINTHPGFTATSLTPEQVLYRSGIDYQGLCVRLVESALARAGNETTQKAAA